MKKLSLFLSAVCLLFAVACGIAEGDRTAADLSTNAMIYPGVHDPAQLIEIDGDLFLFASAVEWSRYTFGSGEWELLGDDLYGESPPDWYAGEGQYWAPSVIEFEPGRYRLYHSAVEDEDAGVSKLSFATLSRSPDGLQISGAGDFIIASRSVDEPFAIDPALFIDDEERHWLLYGSHGAGIVMVELDPATGFLKEDPGQKVWAEQDERFTHIADYGGDLDENNVEAAYVYNHPDSDYYYLFVNWDRCCDGVNSSYNIRVGRSLSPTGPYLDRDGRSLADGGGSLFLDAEGEILDNPRFIGPGHAGIYEHREGTFYFSHHFYDGDNRGEPSLAIWVLNWIDGWPEIEREEDVDF